MKSAQAGELNPVEQVKFTMYVVKLLSQMEAMRLHCPAAADSMRRIAPIRFETRFGGPRCVWYAAGYIDGNAAARASQPYPGMPVTSSSPSARRVFQLILVKPSHYDDDGYVIQWMRSIMPSNSLSAVYGLALDCADRQVLGEDVEIRAEAYDETNLRISAAAVGLEPTPPDHQTPPSQPPLPRPRPEILHRSPDA